MAQTCKHGIPLGIACGYCILFESNNLLRGDLDFARQELSRALDLLDECLDKPLDQNSLHKRISIFLDGTIYTVAHDAQPTNGDNKP